MIRLTADQVRPILTRYLSEPAFFPLIAAVLEGTQDGAVFADHAITPCQVYVEHAFGFAQLFGESRRPFEDRLEEYFSAPRQFSVAKVRLYTPHSPAFLQTDDFSVYRAERQRFILDATPDRRILLAGRQDRSGVEMEDTDEIQARFGIVTRFWRNADQFVRHSQANIVRKEGRIVGLCYAAAIGGGKAEIDVITDPAFRRQGVGQRAVAGFMSACLEVGIEPVWDCFTNNLASVETARSLGFRPRGAPYAFYTVPRI